AEQAVGFLRGIEVRPGAGEGSLALAGLVEVDGVGSGSEPLDAAAEEQPVWGLGDGHLPHAAPLWVLQNRGDRRSVLAPVGRGGRTGRRATGEEQRGDDWKYRAGGHEFTLEESLPQCRGTAPGEMSTPQAIAHTILEGFERRWAQFRAQSVAAKQAFETADRARASELSRLGIDPYDQGVREAVEAVLRQYPNARTDESLWPQVKQVLIGLLYDHKRPECAETFYNWF